MMIFIKNIIIHSVMHINIHKSKHLNSKLSQKMNIFSSAIFRSYGCGYCKQSSWNSCKSELVSEKFFSTSMEW